MHRRQILRGAAAAAAVSACPAWSQGTDRITLRLANNAPPTYPSNLRLKEAFDRVRQKSGGKVDVQLFPAGQLGSDNDMFSQIRSGAIDLYYQAGSVMASAAPAAAINAVGYAFKSHEQVWPAMDGELGARIRAALDAIGLYAFARPMDNGYRQITSSSKPIRSVEDLQGFKIRVAPAPIYVSLFKALNAAPVSMSFGEVYSSLQTRLIDGQENPLVAIEQTRLYEVQKYITLSNHTWDGFWVVANKQVWGGLPQDMRTLIESEVNTSSVAQRVDMARLNETIVDQLKSRGIQFNAVDTEAFRKQLAAGGYYAEWKKRFGDSLWAVLERHTGKLG